jgi:hypothetical protein
MRETSYSTLAVVLIAGYMDYYDTELSAFPIRNLLYSFGNLQDLRFRSLKHAYRFLLELSRVLTHRGLVMLNPPI